MELKIVLGITSIKVHRVMTDHKKNKLNSSGSDRPSANCLFLVHQVAQRIQLAWPNG